MKFQDIDLIKYTGDKARDRYEYMNDEEIMKDLLDSLKDLLMTIKTGYDNEARSRVLSFYLLNSPDMKNEKSRVTSAFGQVLNTLDAVVRNSENLSLVCNVVDNLLDE